MNLRKHGLSVLALLVSIAAVTVLLSSCGETTPAKSQVEEDLAYSLSSSYPFLTLSSAEISQSLTGDGSYTATVDVQAEGVYARHDLVADISYLRYDQGWDMTDCSWTESGYEVTSYPSPEEMTSIVCASGAFDDIYRNQEYVSMECLETNDILFQGAIANNENPYVLRTCFVQSVWAYDAVSGDWKFYSMDEPVWKYDVSKLEGTWPTNLSDSTITISDITEDGFVIDWHFYNIGPIQVTCQESETVFSSAMYRSAENLPVPVKFDNHTYTPYTPLSVQISLKSNDRLEIYALFSAKDDTGDCLNFVDSCIVSYS